jgi:hypothetical protein
MEMEKAAGPMGHVLPGTTCESLGRRLCRDPRGTAGRTHDMQTFPKAAKGTRRGYDLVESGDIAIACERLARGGGRMAAKPRLDGGRRLLPRTRRTSPPCGHEVDDLLMKMHESNPPPKNHNKKILSLV